MSENKTHYRKVFKSDHLSVADLEDLQEQGTKLVFTITHVEQFVYDPNNKNTGIMVAGKRIGANIAHFKEDIKPMVLNATNSKIMKDFNDGSPFVEDWANTLVGLNIGKNIKMMRDVVNGVRISPTKPSTVKPKLNPESDNWQGAIDFFAGGGDIAKLGGYDINEEDLKLLLEKIEEAKNDKS